MSNAPKGEDFLYIEPLHLPPEAASERWARHLAMIYQAGKMALATLDLDDLLSGVAKVIQQGFGYYDTSIFLVDTQTRECVLKAQAGMYQAENVLGYRQKVGVGIVGWVAEHGQTVLANDVTKDPRYVMAFPGETAARSELAVPILLAGVPIGVINVENQHVGAFDERDVTALEAIAQQVAQAIVRARLFLELKFLHLLNKTIVDTIPAGLALLDENLKIYSVNPDFCQKFGRKPEEMIGQNLSDFLSQSAIDAGHLRDVVRAAIATGDCISLAEVRVGSPGSAATGLVQQGERILNVRAIGTELPEGKRAILIIEDITEWREAELRALAFAEKLEMLMAHIPIGINSLDVNGVYTYWSSGSERIFGYSASEMVGRQTPAILMPPGFAVEELLQRCAQLGTVRNEVMMRRKDGSFVPIEQQWVALKDRDNRHVGYTVCFQDVTERRRAEERLLQEKRKLEDVVNAIGAALTLIDREMRITWANSRLHDWFSPRAPVEGKRCYNVYCKRESPCNNCPALQTFQTGQMIEMEDAMATADGQFRYFHHTTAPVRDESGKVIQVLKLTQDVTDHTKKVYQLSRIRQLSEAMQSELDIDKLLHRILTYITAGQALGFNRAILLLLNREKGVLEGKMGVGPDSGEHAAKIWREISAEGRTLQDLLNTDVIPSPPPESVMMRLARGLQIPLSEERCFIVAALREKRPYIVRQGHTESGMSKELADMFGAKEMVAVPLIARNEPIGVLIADNLYSGQPITEEHVELLNMFAAQAGIAIQNAEQYRKLREQMEELSRAYQQLEKAQKELVMSERLSAIGRMAAHVAHEIRNPLVTIGGFARALYSRAGNLERNSRSAKIIMDEVSRLERILEDVMNFTRPARPMFREWDVNQVVHDTLLLIESRARRLGVKVVLNLAKTLPLISIDPEQIKQVLLNLMQNALDCMPQGGTLSITTQLTPEAVEIAVNNTGEPISPKHMPNLFEPFFTTKPGGTGLGLAVSQKIAHDHGGEIRVASAPEIGTTFTVVLPRFRKQR